MIFLTTVTAVTTVFFFKLSPYFWKEKFDTFDNRYDVFRAALCNSCDDFWWRGCVIFLERLCDLVCGEVA